MRSNWPRISVRLHPDLMRRLQEVEQERRWWFRRGARSQIVCEAIREYIDRNTKRSA
jgi:metal-responsive CopG/Arc/MetJ family transcriptional regulator